MKMISMDFTGKQKNLYKNLFQVKWLFLFSVNWTITAKSVKIIYNKKLILMYLHTDIHFYVFR